MKIAVVSCGVAVLLLAPAAALAQSPIACAQATRHAFDDYPHPYKLAKLSLPGGQGANLLMNVSVAGERNPDCGGTRDGATCFVQGPAMVKVQAPGGEHGLFSVPAGQEARISAAPQLRCELGPLPAPEAAGQ